MGDSDKLLDSGPGSYRFVEHRRYLDALLEALDARERVTLVVHDWAVPSASTGPAPSRKAVKGIAFMEAIVAPQDPGHWDKIGMRPALQALRSEAGETMVLQNSYFVEEILPNAILRHPRRRGDGAVPTAVRRARRRTTATTCPGRSPSKASPPTRSRSRPLR